MDQVDLSQARFVKVSAAVRYWEDARVNGVEDVDGTLIPFRTGELWLPIIDLATGQFLDWPAGLEANIHYKVCDAGEYWLLNEARQRIAKWKGYYVPDDVLCVGDRGYGDYIILKVGADGVVLGWQKPYLDEERWLAV